MNKYWFKTKLYGYGFTPISWEGYLTTIGITGILILSAFSHSFFIDLGPSLEQTAGFIVDMILIVSLFTIIFIPKTQGKLKWNWGKRK